LYPIRSNVQSISKAHGGVLDVVDTNAVAWAYHRSVVVGKWDGGWFILTKYVGDNLMPNAQAAV
jgi:hypothetical protein